MCGHFLKFVCLFVLMFVCGGRPYTLDKQNCDLSKQTKSHHWDYLQFVVQWPQSVCLQFNHSGHSHHSHRIRKRCIIPGSIRHWTIHGTWPSKVNTRKHTPQNCNTSWTFSLDEISDLLPELNQSWPNLIVGSDLGSFWGHEWSMHGTCCANLPALYGEHNYFSKTLDFRQNFNIDKALSDAGIVPSSSARYKLTDIQQALRSAIGVTPDIQCFSLPKNKSSQVGLQCLTEIHLCLDKTLSPIDCPRSGGDPGSDSGSLNLTDCSPATEIALPPIRTMILI